MPRFFNTTGPCDPADHYMLPPLRRLPSELAMYIERKQYFVIHAPRQTGKTTALQALATELTQQGRYAAVLVSAEQGQAFEDVGRAEATMLREWSRVARNLPEELRPPPWPETTPGDSIHAALAAWAEHCPRPLVVFIDEIDSLRDDVLISMLRQLRDGHRSRPAHFPSSLALVGLRDVRDYGSSGPTEDHLGTASPFNIKVRSLTLTNFSIEEVAELYAHHTSETGQPFELEAIARAYALTQGQPWLVNALADEAIQSLRPDPREPITQDDIGRAAAIIIERRDTHLDSLSARLREPRVRAVIEPMLAGELMGDVAEDDRRFLIDLGLVYRHAGGGLEVANPIYREVIVRQLASSTQDSLPRLAPSWLDSEGKLDPDALCEAFMAFWRQHGEALQRSAPYHEVAAQLVLMAFLHRVVNGGGSIEREYAIGRGRIDLCLHMGEVTVAMELKVWRDGRPDPEPGGLAQLDGYLDGLDLSTGWLVIFDQRSHAEPVSERTRRQTVRSPAGRDIVLVWA